jgi:hypothetical protein
MKILLLFVVTIQAWSVFGFGNSCKFEREDAIVCFKKYVDINHDNVISIAELDRARTKYETFALKEAEALLKFRIVKYWLGEINITTAKVVEDCDYNHDGKFTTEDFRKATKTCLPSKYGLCLLKKVCDEAARVENKHHYQKLKKGRLHSWRDWF